MLHQQVGLTSRQILAWQHKNIQRQGLVMIFFHCRHPPQIMENINNFSRQRGRVIEFRELLYGYTRTNAIFGQDLILDLLLVYKKYRGKKMTVPVRRHLYIQRSFTEIRIREMVTDAQPTVHTYGDSISSSKTNSHVLSRHQTMGVHVQSSKQNNENGGKLAKNDPKWSKFFLLSFQFFRRG
jgi:Chondroitin N-acetylgalactosaminyltransferase